LYHVQISTLEVCYENALYKFTFDVDIDIAVNEMEYIMCDRA